MTAQARLDARLAQGVRHLYVMGDLHGCKRAFDEILDAMAFDPKQDVLILTGDLVARGEDSLGVLLQCYALANAGALFSVLGNHDLTALGVHFGIRRACPKDKMTKVHQNADQAVWDWLMSCPLILRPSAQVTVVHAGIPWFWEHRAQALSDAFSSALRGNPRVVLAEIFGKADARAIRACIVDPHPKNISDYFTRMRLIAPDGTLDSSYKGPLGGNYPTGYLPWFHYKQPDAPNLWFGHWAALEGRTDTKTAINLDGGCVWGGRLLYRRIF